MRGLITWLHGRFNTCFSKSGRPLQVSFVWVSLLCVCVGTRNKEVTKVVALSGSDQSQIKGWLQSFLFWGSRMGTWVYFATFFRVLDFGIWAKAKTKSDTCLRSVRSFRSSRALPPGRRSKPQRLALERTALGSLLPLCVFQWEASLHNP